jgi:hypothetical protein
MHHLSCTLYVTCRAGGGLLAERLSLAFQWHFIGFSMVISLVVSELPEICLQMLLFIPYAALCCQKSVGLRFGGVALRMLSGSCMPVPYWCCQRPPTKLALAIQQVLRCPDYIKSFQQMDCRRYENARHTVRERKANGTLTAWQIGR